MPSEGGDAMLEVREVSRQFGGVAAVQGVSLSIQRGRITGLIGPNGAGKSTVINMIAGSIRPDSGSIRFEGREIAGEPAYRIARRGIIRTFQASTLFSHLTVLENLLAAVQSARGESLWQACLGRRYWRSEQAVAVERARVLLEGFGLADAEDAYAADLSGGQKRLVEIMRALMAQPKVMILDEPISGISPTTASVMADRLSALAADGLTMLIVEHEMWFVERVCDHIVVMAQGEVLSEGTMNDVRANQAVISAYLS